MKSLACLVALAACTDPAPTAVSAPAPLLDVSGGNDVADRGCNVVLRQLERVQQGAGSGDFETDGASWAFVAEIEISTSAASQGLAPALLYQTADGSWATAGGAADPDGATPGFVKYAITLDAGVPGPTTANQTLIAIPYLLLTGGGRLFDHNRNSADLSNYALDADNDWTIWPAPAVCAAPTDSRGATLTFGADFKDNQDGVLVPGGSVTISYAAARAPTCRGTGWDITAHILVDGDGQQLAASVASGPATFTIPTDGARALEVYFENTDATGCTAYDSAYGANYVFAVETPPAWLGLAGNLLTRDPSSHCAGAVEASDGFAYDTWTRVQADVTNLCFQVYQPGETDTFDPNLWQQLDAELHWRVTNGSATTPWTITPVGFDAQVGNNAQYAQSWRELDPFRDYHCPELAATPTSDGMYIQLQVEYFIAVNGGELHPEPGADFVGTFIDYPTNPWRTANCP